MVRQFVNRLPGYNESNAVLYVQNSETRSCERKWKVCDNYHVLTWIPGIGESEPDTESCERCVIEYSCNCEGTDLLRYGCQCGGK